MDYNYLKLIANMLILCVFITGFGCANYLWIAITGKSLIQHSIFLYIFGILGIIMMIVAIMGFINLKLVL